MNEKMDDTNKRDDTTRFQRWQTIAIDQLTYALNVFLTLTIATLGYWFSLLRDDGFTPGATAKSFMLLSFLALAGSVICGLVCIAFRLQDVRGTAQRARGRCAPTHDELSGLGHWTWMLFYAHLLGFALGVGLLVVTLFLTYGGRIT